MAVMPWPSFRWWEAALALPRYLLLISAGGGSAGRLQHPGSFELCKSMRAEQPMGEHLDLHTR